VPKFHLRKKEGSMTLFPVPLGLGTRTNQVILDYIILQTIFFSKVEWH